MEIIKLNGFIELVFLIGFVDRIVDIVLIGWILKENGFVELEYICDIILCFIVNLVSYCMKDDVIDEMVVRLVRVVEGDMVK